MARGCSNTRTARGGRTPTNRSARGSERGTASGVVVEAGRGHGSGAAGFRARSLPYDPELLRPRPFRLMVRDAEMAIDASYFFRLRLRVPRPRALGLLVRVHGVRVV